MVRRKSWESEWVVKDVLFFI